MNGCPSLSVFYGEVTYNRSAVGERFPVGTKGTYHCNDTIVTGWTTRICQKSGVWDGWPILCRKSEEYEKLYCFSQASAMPRTYLPIN